MATFAHADVIELEGKVKSIDKDARTISVLRKTTKGEKTLELEVAKKAGDLSEVEEGDSVSFSYDPELELITKISEEGGRDQESPSGAEDPLVAALKRKLQGTSLYNAKTGVFSVSYDFRDNKQLKDFTLSPNSVARIRDKTFTLDRGCDVQHTVHFELARVTGVMLRLGEMGKLSFSNHPECVAYGGGSIRTPPPASVKDLDRNAQIQAVQQGKAVQWWSDIGGLPLNTPAPFAWSMDGEQASWESGGKKGSLPYRVAAVGALRIETPQNGLVFRKLEISGRIDTEWYKNHKEEFLNTQE